MSAVVGEGAAPPSPTALWGLVHLRSAAISFVFLYHYRMFAHPAWIDTIGAFGWTGVDLFFVLSGFLISRQLFGAIARRGTFSLRQFYFKRLLRIIPAYLVVLGCYFALPAIHEREALPPLWKLLTFTQNLGLDLGTSGTFSHAWSLCIEEQFYLVLPLVLLALSTPAAWRRAPWLLAALLVAGCVARAVVYATKVAPLLPTGDTGIVWYEWIYYPTWSRLDGLLTGIAIAALWEFRPAHRAALGRHGNRLLALAALGLAAAAWLFGEPQSRAGSIVAFPFISLAYGVLLLGAISPSSLLYRQASWLSHWLATLSYALYLVHKACIHVAQGQLGRLGLEPSGVAMFVGCALASLAGALALHLAVERPILRWRDRALAAAARPGPDQSPP